MVGFNSLFMLLNDLNLCLVLAERFLDVAQDQLLLPHKTVLLLMLNSRIRNRLGPDYLTCRKLDMMSIGTGKMIVLLFSAEIPLRV